MAFVSAQLSSLPSSSPHYTLVNKGTRVPLFLGNARAPPPPLGNGRRSPAPLLCQATISQNDVAQLLLPEKTADVDPQSVVFGRKSFPSHFIFGAASAAYQVEGAANEEGRGPSIWDDFVHNHPEKIDDRSTGDLACDSYHRYKEDIKLLKKLGMDSYRFSISWSRILPDGTVKGGINQAGIDYYNKLINRLIKKGIKPFVTLFHWDVPQALEEKYGGFLHKKIVDDFRDYCEVCFDIFGDRVKHWITLNEPTTFVTHGYETGIFAPGRCSKCSDGDSSIEPYVVTHNLLLSHAKAFRLYENKFKAKQNGEVGITLTTEWVTPYSNKKQHMDAADRSMDFKYGWYMDPLVHGDYPFIMKALVRERLPKFREEESKMLMGSFHFIGLNYYTTNYGYSIPFEKKDLPESYTSDAYVDLRVYKDGVAIGDETATDWLYVYPKGIRELLLYTKEKYNDPIIYITENGTCELDNDKISLEEALDDNARIRYYSQHLAEVQEAIRLGVKVNGYFAWSLMDNFEWKNGYKVRFGLTYVDYKDDLKRHAKASFRWFANFLKS